MNIRQDGPVYRFPLALVNMIESIDVYEIEIYATADPVVVVMRGHPGASHEMSITNNVERVANEVTARFLIPMGIEPSLVRWIENYPGDNTWNVVTFSTLKPPFSDPSWEDTVPYKYDWDETLPDVARRELIQELNSDVLADNTFWFSTGECYRAATGECSLKAGAKTDDGTGEAGYAYCRELAHYAVIWNAIKEFYCELGESLPEALDFEEISDGLAQKLRTLQSPYGKVGDVEKNVSKARYLYSPYTINPIFGCQEKAGKVDLPDGHHRACVHRHLGLPLTVRVEVEEPRER